MLKIDENGNVHDRIEQLADYFHKGNKAAFGRGADIQSGVLAGIIGGRKNKPSFEVLQKILTGYPTVNPHWLLFGRGPMLLDGPQATLEVKASEFATQEQVEALREKVNKQMTFLEEFKHALSEQEQLMQVYRLGDVNPTSKKLADRLSITDEEARELVLSGRIRSKYLGKDNDRARRNGSSYLVTELAVREFLDQKGT